VPDQARVVSAAMASETGSGDFTLYGVEVTPSDGGAPWTVQHRFRCAARSRRLSCAQDYKKTFVARIESHFIARTLRKPLKCACHAPARSSTESHEPVV
jgi:hypothetical protein